MVNICVCVSSLDCTLSTRHYRPFPLQMVSVHSQDVKILAFIRFAAVVGISLMM